MSHFELSHDVLDMLEEQYALYQELLEVSRSQERLLEGTLTTASLQRLMRRREDLYLRIEATEQVTDSLLGELRGQPPEAVRCVAEAIGLTLEAILEVDAANEARLLCTEESEVTTH